MLERNIRITPNLSIPLSEISFRTSRSSGPGGQNVNKLETKVELVFDIFDSRAIAQSERDIILRRLHRAIGPSGLLTITEQRSRSQFQNKQLALERFRAMLLGALTPQKKRLKTRPSRTSGVKRLEAKRRHSEKKRLRASRPE